MLTMIIISMWMNSGYLSFLFPYSGFFCFVFWFFNEHKLFFKSRRESSLSFPIKEGRKGERKEGKARQNREGKRGWGILSICKHAAESSVTFLNENVSRDVC